jgi:nitrite reductase/ring-hydroxylating ferredoxin subunit
MSWRQVLRADRLAPDGAPVLVEVDDKSIGLYRNGPAVRAVLNYCPHKGAPICRGRIENFAPVTIPGEPLLLDCSRRVLRCPWHHWEFFLDTGRPVLPVKQRLKLYPTKTSDGWVYVDL